MGKLNPGFMAEIFKLMFFDEVIMRIASEYLKYELIPKEWVGYKFILREAIIQYTEKNKLPSIGVICQKLCDEDAVQLAAKEIKKAALIDREIAIDQLQSFVKETEFELLSRKVHDLYEEGKKEEAIRVNAEESQRILEMSFRSKSGGFQSVFGGFQQRMLERRMDAATITEKPVKIPFGIDRLDDISFGGMEIGDTTLWIARSGTGKALTLDSKILTPTGYILMKDAKVGDIICDRKGGTQTIVGVYPQGRKKAYRVTFADGSFVDCSKDHLWTIWDNYHNSKGYETMPLSEMMEKGIKFGGHHNGQKYLTKNNIVRYGSYPRPRFSIPLVEGVDLGEKEVFIDPYTLGVLLGDGSFSDKAGNLTVTLPDNEIMEKLKFPEQIYLKYVARYAYRINKGESEHNFHYYLKKYGLFGKLSHEKFIPKDYIFNNKNVRLEVLRGLLDTDGYVEKTGQIELSLSSKQLIEDATFIARSLGCLCKISEPKRASYVNKKRERVICKYRYRLRITPPKGLDLFHLSRKHEREINPKKKNFVERRIVSVEYIGIKEMQCIKVSGKEGLFLTNDFIVTHNTTVLKWHGYSAAIRGVPVLHIQLEGGVKACMQIYDQLWSAQSYSDIKSGNISPKDRKKIEQAIKEVKELSSDIEVYGFKKFGQASMGDVRQLCYDYFNTHGKFPGLVILDSLDLVKTGISKKIDSDPDHKKEKLQTCAQLLKNLADEIGAPIITATQTSDVPFEVWNNPDKVIDRSYTEGDKTLVKPFSFVFTLNMTIEEKANATARIYVDKLRDYKESQEVITIATNYDKRRFYHRGRTMEMYNQISERKEIKKQARKKKTEADKMESI